MVGPVQLCLCRFMNWLPGYGSRHNVPCISASSGLVLQAPRQNKAKAPRGAAISDDAVALGPIADPGEGLREGLGGAVLLDEADGVNHLAIQVAITHAGDK